MNLFINAIKNIAIQIHIQIKEYSPATPLKIGPSNIITAIVEPNGFLNIEHNLNTIKHTNTIANALIIIKLGEL